MTPWFLTLGMKIGTMTPKKTQMDVMTMNGIFAPYSPYATILELGLLSNGTERYTAMGIGRLSPISL